MARPSKDRYFLEMARLVATRSTCLRRHVGCVLVNARGHVLATGYNGVAAGQPHCNEPTHRVREGDPELEETFCPTRPAETPEPHGKPLLYRFRGEPPDDFSEPLEFEVYGHACAGAGARSGEDLDACQAIHAEQNALLQCRDVAEVDSVYCTDEPCPSCAKLLLGTGARRVVFSQPYAGSGGVSRGLWYRSRAVGLLQEPETWLYHPLPA